MEELIWFLLASVPFVTGLSFVVMGWRERWQKLPVRARVDRR